MTRIDFYVLAEGGADAHERLACRLVEKAYTLGHRVFVHAASEDQARRLDDLLWTFRAGSFVPHALAGTADEGDVPVRIGHRAPEDPGAEVLVNLADTVPEGFTRFERVAEVVPPVEPQRTQARERYRFYRERGYPLHTHRL